MSIAAADVRAWIGAYAAAIAERRAELVRLDTAIGDGDHGTNMDRGMKKAVGMALVSKVGGAAGPLYGTLFLQMGTASAGRSELDLAGWAAALDAGVKGVQMRGKAELEDKTMIDALVPALDALRAAESDGADLGDALRRSADAAEEGVKATVPLEARKGRASYLGPRSVGHEDPGAVSTALILGALAGAAQAGR